LIKNNTMPTMRELETTLRSIRHTIRGAMNHTTGVVDADIIHDAGLKMKEWAGDFEGNYISKAEQKSQKSQPIRTGGLKLTKDAWFCYEILCAIEIDATGAPPAGIKWEKPPSGVVPGELKAQIDEEINKLLTDFTEFRRTVLEE